MKSPFITETAYGVMGSGLESDHYRCSARMWPFRRHRWIVVAADEWKTMSGRPYYPVNLQCNLCGCTESANLIGCKAAILASGLKFSDAAARAIGIIVTVQSQAPPGADPVQHWAETGRLPRPPWKDPVVVWGERIQKLVLLPLLPFRLAFRAATLPIRMAWRAVSWPFRFVARNAESCVAATVIVSCAGGIIYGIHIATVVHPRDVARAELERARRCAETAVSGEVTSVESFVILTDRDGRSYWRAKVSVNGISSVAVSSYQPAPTVGSRGRICGEAHWHAEEPAPKPERKAEEF